MPRKIQLQTQSSPGGKKPYWRKFQPSEMKRAGQARNTSPIQPAPSPAPPHSISPTDRMPPRIDSGVEAITASGQTTSISYGPPDAQKPPTSSTARIPHHNKVRLKARPATPIR